MKYNTTVKAHTVHSAGDIIRTDEVVKGGQQAIHIVAKNDANNDRIEMYMTIDELDMILKKHFAAIWDQAQRYRELRDKTAQYAYTFEANDAAYEDELLLRIGRDAADAFGLIE